MDREIRSVFASVLIITTLSIPVAAIIVVTALIYVFKIFLASMDKFCAYFQHKLELFNELYEDNQEPAWDELGLFAAFIKGEDVLGCCQKKKNSLRPKAEKTNKATIIERYDREIAMTTGMKRPLIGESYLREFLQRPYDVLHVCTGFTSKRVAFLLTKGIRITSRLMLLCQIHAVQ